MSARQRRDPSRARRLAAVIPASTTHLLLASESATCPSCPVGRAARADVFDRDFGTNLLIALFPFLVIGLVSRAAERLGRRAPPGERARRARGREEDET